MVFAMASVTLVAGCAQSIDGRYADDALAHTISELVANNALVSNGFVEPSFHADLRATAVLHQANSHALPSVDAHALAQLCDHYLTVVPHSQSLEEISHLVPMDQFQQVIDFIGCLETAPPNFRASQDDPMTFLTAIATWLDLPGSDPDHVNTAEIEAAISALPESEGTSAWTHWMCQRITTSVATSHCDHLPAAQQPIQATTTEELMDARAWIELGQELDQQLLNEILAIEVTDALDAEQILRITTLAGNMDQVLPSGCLAAVSS